VLLSPVLQNDVFSTKPIWITFEGNQHCIIFFEEKVISEKINQSALGASGSVFFQHSWILFQSLFSFKKVWNFQGDLEQKPNHLLREDL
jgi:hypothetical protein